MEAKTVLTAEDRTRQAFASVQANLGELSEKARLAAGTLAGLGGAVTIGGLVALAKAVVDDIDAMNDLADATGASIENISALDDVARRNGASFDTVSTSLVKFNQVLAATEKPGSEAERILKALNLNVKELRSLDPAVALQKTAVAFNTFTTNGDKARAAQELFGKSLRDVAPFMKDLAESGELHARITTQQAEEAEKLNKQLFAMQANATNAKRQMVAEFLPTMTSFVEVMSQADERGSTFAQTFGAIAKTVVQTATVAFLELRFVLKGVGNEIGGIAAQLVALAQFDFKRFSSIGQEMRDDAVRRRREQDAAIARVMGTDLRDVEAGDALSRRLAPRTGRLNIPGADGKSSEFDSLMKGIKERLALAREQLDAGRLLTEQEKYYAKVLADVEVAAGKLSAKQKDAIRLKLEELKVADLAKAVQKAEYDQALEIAKERQRLTNEGYEQAKQLEAVNRDLLDVGKKTLDQLEFEISLMGMSNQQREIAVAMRELETAGIKRGTPAWEAYADAIAKATERRGKLQEQADFFKSSFESVDRTARDVFTNIFESGAGTFKRLGQTLKSSLLDMLYQMTVRKWVIQITGSVMGAPASMISQYLGQDGGGLLSLFGGGGGTGGLGNISSLGNMFNGGLTAPGSMYYNFATSGIGQSLGLSNAAPIIGNNVSAFAPAGTQLSGVGGMGGMGGMGAAAGSAAALAIIVKAFIDTYKATKGETRGGGRYGWNAATGGADFIDGPSGGDPQQDVSKGIITGTAASISAGLKAIGSNLTLSALQGAWEQSINSRGGVFMGGTLSNGVSFGESGQGTNYDWTSPFDSKYEMWGAENGQVGLGAGANYRGMVGKFDMTGDPAKLATDAQQTLIGAIKAAFGQVPKIVAENFDLSGYTIQGEVDTNVADGTGTRWLRVYDEAVKAELRQTMPKRLQELGLIDIDPELLSAEDTQKLTEKLSKLFENVNGFRTIVENMPIERLRKASFDAAASIVEFSGGLEQFTSNLSAYIDNFYTEEEKRTQIAKSLQSQLRGVGLNFSVEQILTGTRAKFRELVEMFEGANDEGGQRTYATLLGIAGAFASITPEMAAATSTSEAYSQTLREQTSLLQDVIDKNDAWADSLKRFLHELTMGPLAQLSPEARYRAAQAEFDRLAAMPVGSEERMKGLEAAGREFLEASQAYNASSMAYFVDLAKVKGAVQASEVSARSTADVARLQLNVLQSQLSTLNTIAANTAAAAAQTSASAAAAGGGAAWGGSATVGSGAASGSGAGQVIVGLTSLGIPIYGPAGSGGASAAQPSGSGGAAWGGSATIPSYDVGTNFVPRDGLAMLHYGERVQRRDENPFAGGRDPNEGLRSEIRALRTENARLLENMAAVLQAFAQGNLNQGAEIVAGLRATRDQAQLAAAKAVPV